MMKIDLVTKVALVIIAGCLVLLTIKNFLPTPAVARGEEIIKVDLVGIDGKGIWQAININLARGGGYPISKRELLGKE